MTEGSSLDHPLDVDASFDIPDDPLPNAAGLSMPVEPETSSATERIQCSVSASGRSIGVPTALPPPAVEVAEAPWKVPRRVAFAEKLRARISAKTETKPVDVGGPMLGVPGLAKTSPIMPEGDMWELMDMHFEAPLEIEKSGTDHLGSVGQIDGQASLGSQPDALKDLGSPVEEAWWAFSAMD